MKRLVTVIFLSGVWLAAFSALPAPPAHGQQSPPQQQKKKCGNYSSKAEYLSASAEEVRKGLGTSLPDPSKQIDKLAVDLLKELDAINTMSTQLYWDDGCGSSAHPQLGIALDRAQVVALYDALGRDKFREVIKFVLAHEQAHMAQFRTYSLDSMKDPSKTRAIECQADILGGFSVSLSLLHEGKPPSYTNDAIELWARLGEKIGSPEWDDQSKHPRPEQRMRAISLGLNAGTYQILVLRYKQTNDPKLLKEIQDWHASVPDLFDIDENLFVWSNRVAKKIVRYEAPPR